MFFGRILTLTVAIGVLAAAPAAAEMHVTSSGSSGAGTLRDAVAAAPPGETIVIDPGVNPLLTEEVKVDKSLTIRGQGAGATVVSGGDSTRVFNVGSLVQGIAVRIEALRIAGGRAPDGAAGIHETPSTPAQPGLPGQGGGAILSAANLLELVAVELRDNAAGNGGVGGNASFGTFGIGGSGGGGGSGGAIANSGTLSIIRSILTENAAGTGGSGGTSFTPTAPSPAGGASGSGGAIANTGIITIADSTFMGNEAGDGANGRASGGVFAPPGSPGGDGGAIVSSGTLSLSGTTLDENAAGNGGNGGFSSSVGGSGGSGGSGGAIHAAGIVRLTNSTLVANEAGSGGVGGSGPNFGGAGGAGGSGGALTATPGSSVTVAAATIAGNSAGIGGAGGLGSTFSGTTGLNGGGGGIQGSAAVNVRASIVSDNTAASAPNCGGTVADGGGNLAFPDAGGCGGFAVADPKLDPAGLGDNGGPTATVALLAGSAALNLVPAASCAAADGAPLMVDQRGVARPQEGACDAGAFERIVGKPPPPPQPPGQAAADTHPTPNTKIAKKPKKKVRTAKKRAKVVFRFTSTVPGSSFECKLDKGRFVPCRSPKRYRPKAGKHRFQVRAVANGIVDPKPATVRFKVVRVDRSKAGSRKKRGGGGKRR